MANVTQIKKKRPPGRRPYGATWLEDEGRYEYAQAYYDIREKALKESRAKAYANHKEKLQMLKKERPHLWDRKRNKVSQMQMPTLDIFLKTNVSGTIDTNLPRPEFSECICLPQSTQTKGDTCSSEGCRGVCQQQIRTTDFSSTPET